MPAPRRSIHPESLRVRSGEVVRAEHINGLVALVEDVVRSHEIHAGGGVRLDQSDYGTWAEAEPETAYSNPFRVGLSGSSAYVAPGTVNAMFPAIAGQLLDGTNYGSGETGPAPKFDLVGARPGPSGYGWLCIRVDARVPVEDWPDDPPRIVYRGLPPRVRDDKEAEQIGHIGLALIIFDRGASPAPLTVHQIVRHNLEHDYSNGRHYFRGDA